MIKKYLPFNNKEAIDKLISELISQGYVLLRHSEFESMVLQAIGKFNVQKYFKQEFHDKCLRLKILDKESLMNGGRPNSGKKAVLSRSKVNPAQEQTNKTVIKRCIKKKLSDGLSERVKSRHVHNPESLIGMSIDAISSRFNKSPHKLTVILNKHGFNVTANSFLTTEMYNVVKEWLINLLLLQNRHRDAHRIKYNHHKGFNKFKPSLGIPGNYYKLIYNHPKY